jgi:hypothetical protein
MLTKTKIALAAALILGTASAVLAADSGENDQGGFVMPGSTVGVNPVLHPDEFRGYAAHTGKPGNAYGFVTARTQQEVLSQSRKNSHSY